MVCSSCLLKENEIGIPEQLKVLRNEKMFLEENISELITKWMLGTDTKDLVLPEVCTVVQQWELSEMLKDLRLYFSIKKITWSQDFPFQLLIDFEAYLKLNFF